ncbi:2-amino-4-hydroxy-6-hydroxymethyldihydropteridinediphosphokinase [Roseivivax sediminis]|uniref:2-amino-4-hydroxy-6-hydroxymethyldihydropteridine pyrophosphokinase n=2 Tax=Roseivivax sediminis TaxID=936889 RepID=A0A1I2A7J0_9RHOB|nr:2-amino-4-hydroxy-6-hydroxymethyldihydropteridinediphosphokinase [Roseivivax sediminis]
MAAIAAFGAEGLGLRRLSRFYANPCFPKGMGPDFVNAVAVADTADLGGDAVAVLAALHRIEARFGRARSTRWAGRVLDLDLLALGGRIFPDPEKQAEWRALPLGIQQSVAPEELILPHPRLQDRAFVLVPMRDVAPGWHHPATGCDVTGMLAALPAAAVAEVIPM